MSACTRSYGTELHDFSVSMTKITGPAKVIQFTGNSSLGAILTEELVVPGGATHYPSRRSRQSSSAAAALREAC